MAAPATSAQGGKAPPLALAAPAASSAALCLLACAPPGGTAFTAAADGLALTVPGAASGSDLVITSLAPALIYLHALRSSGGCIGVGGGGGGGGGAAPPVAPAAVELLSLAAALHSPQPAAAQAAAARLEAALLAPGAAAPASPFFGEAAAPGIADVAAAAAVARGAAAGPRLLRLHAAIAPLPFFAAAVAALLAAAPAAPPAPAPAPAKAAKGATAKGGAAAASAAASPVAALASYVTAAPFDVRSEPQMSSCILYELGRTFSAAIRAAFPQTEALGLDSADLQLNSQMGSGRFVHHYQCNSALALFAQLRAPGDAKKGKKDKKAAAAAGGLAVPMAAEDSPAPVVPAPEEPLRPAGPVPASPVAAALAVIAAVEAQGAHALIGRLEASGPGYINIYLAANYVSARLAFLLARGVRASPSPGAGVGGVSRRVAIDYSSPNIAKEMHVGHLRSTIIGDSLARILEFCGHEVLRINHVGDWGTQFGMLIAHLKDLLASGAVTDEQLDASIGDLSGFYKAAKKRFDAEPDFKKRAHENVVALQSGDAANLAYWRRMVAVSARMFSEVYARLGVDSRLELKGESYYNDKIPAVIAELQAKGLLADSEGATVLRVPGHEVPLMVRKSDGGFGYDSTDLAAIRHRLVDLRCDWLIYVVDSGQQLHFDLVFCGAQMAGWYTPANFGGRAAAAHPFSVAGAPPARVDHCAFGVVQSKDEDGNVTKFKTRSGDTVRLIEVLDTARAKARAALAERAGGGGLAEAGADEAAAVLGYGGVQYFDLRQSRTSDYIFDYERMLSADGDTAVYLEYAHARVCSILRRARDEKGVDVTALVAAAASPASSEAARALFSFEHASELALAVDLMRVQDVLAVVQADLFPHRLCEYLYFLAGKLTDFYRDCNILGGDTPAALRDSRLRLCAATALVLRTGLGLLGIRALEKI